MARKLFGPYQYPDGSICRGIYWVNGHPMNVSRVTGIRQIAPGRFEIDTKHNGIWRCEGGSKLGGAANEWFLDQGENDPNPYIPCTGIADAVRCLEAM